MPLRPDEDVSAQTEALAAARSELSDLLARLSVEAKKASKSALTKRGNPDLPTVYALSRAIERAEEAVDMAITDLHSASGYDV